MFRSRGRVKQLEYAREDWAAKKRQSRDEENRIREGFAPRDCFLHATRQHNGGYATLNPANALVYGSRHATADEYVRDPCFFSFPPAPSLHRISNRLAHSQILSASAVCRIAG